VADVEGIIEKGTDVLDKVGL